MVGREAFTPLCPVGHLPHKGGDQPTLLSLQNLKHFRLCKGVDANVISPLVGGPKDGRDPWLAPESDRTEGGEHRYPRPIC
ncbi:hypothetical protein FHW17_001817 [Phyllobacterium sp. P30BS-XVII]|nr:hypothetical protein [Phyllobacterium sp. P30BS-XVII]